MDINALLSPQDSPRATPPATKGPSNVARLASHGPPSSLRPSLPSQRSGSSVNPSPTSYPRSSMPAQPARAPSYHLPTNASPSPGPTSGHVKSKLSHEEPMSGMDTLADLASMQRHQHAPGTQRTSAPPELQAPSMGPPASAVRPSLRDISRTHSGSRSTLDIAMADAPDRTSSSKAFSSKALNQEELDQLSQLSAQVAEAPNTYEAHVQLIKLLRRGFVNHNEESSHGPTDPRSYSLLNDLHRAVEAMTARYALGEKMWVERLHDRQIIASSLEECLGLVELYEKALSEEVGSTKLWSMYGGWMTTLARAVNATEATGPEDDAALQRLLTNMQWSDEDRVMATELFGPAQVLDVWRRAAEATKDNINDSRVTWDAYTALILQDILKSPSPDAISATRSHFIERLSTAHAGWDDTFQQFSTFTSTYDNANYEETMIAANEASAEAKDKYSAREAHELRLEQAANDHDRVAEWSAFAAYLDFELSQSHKKKAFSFVLANALYQRALLRFPSVVELWEDYLAFLGDEAEHQRHPISRLSVIGRACAHCPWSGALWAMYIQLAECDKIPFPDIGQIKHKATSTGLLDSSSLEDVLKTHAAWCNFLRRQAFLNDSTDEDTDIAEVGIRSALEDIETLGRQRHGKEWKGDPQYRLERIYIKFLDQNRNHRAAREQWQSLVRRHGSSYSFWLRYHSWEMSTWSFLRTDTSPPNSIPREATNVLAAAAKRTDLDWPEKVLDTYLTHCELQEDMEHLQTAIRQCRKGFKMIAKRREREAAQPAEAAGLAVEYNAAVSNINGDAIAKRRHEGDDQEIPWKRAKTNGDHSLEVPEDSLSASASLQKRDRENNTVIVRGLPPKASEKRIRSYFDECGVIKSINVTVEDDNESATAMIEFESHADVLTAQTRDMKTLDGKSISVQVGTGTTLYVTNFPPSADEIYLRNIFDQYGDIVDVRFPSLKYNAHRRFCYIQFKSAAQAMAAAEVDGRVLDGGLKLVAKLSDPQRKAKRQGAMHEGREVYVGNVDWSATEDDLRKLFVKYGDVESVKIPRNMTGKSKGMAFVTFGDKTQAEAAVDLDNVKFKSRILTVAVATSNHAKRQTTKIISKATNDDSSLDVARSPQTELKDQTEDAIIPDIGSPDLGENPSVGNITARTVALLNVPDTVSDARIQALMEPYGTLVKINLRPDHAGAVVEYADTASAGKAALAIEGTEILPRRRLGVGSVKELLASKPERKGDATLTSKAGTAATTKPASLQGLPVRRPGQGGRRGGLGFKRGNAGNPASKKSTAENAVDAGLNNASKATATDKSNGEETKESRSKSNADFKAFYDRK